MQQKNLMTEQELTDKLTRAYDKVMSKQMTEIEQIRQEIKVLEKKLELMEKLKDYKSPCEEAYKRVFGIYPEFPSDVRFGYFKAGYEAAQQTYKVGTYQPTLQTPEQVEEGLKQAFREAKEEWKNSKPMNEVVVKDPPDSLKFQLGKTLEDVIREWTTIFNIRGDMDRTTMVQDLCDKIYGWLPAKQSSKGTQRIETEIAVDSHNELLTKIKSKIYSNEGHSN
jgi:flagellar hook-basal body complex protein FliE